MILVGHNITNSTNIGGLLRLADAFALEKVIFTGPVSLDTRKVKKVSRDTHRFVHWEIAEFTLEILEELKNSGYHICGLEIDDSSINLTDLSLATSEKYVLVIGNEQHGISKDLLSLCDVVVYIPMLGKNESMNVTSATAIALYHLNYRSISPIS